MSRVSKTHRHPWGLFWVMLRVVMGAYALAIALVLVPFIQTRILYAQHIDYFGYTKFDHPEQYGLAPGKTVNVRIETSDNVTLGAWLVFSEPYYRTLPFPPPPSFALSTPGNASTHELISSSLKRTPTILFLHGNTGTRALHLRTALYTALTARLQANILAIDYRGFGDSEGSPSVNGLGRDARAGWDWLMAHGAMPEDVLVVGHSLGTAAAGLLGAELGREGIKARGVVLLAPFSSVRTLMDEYYLFGCLPLLKPLSMIPLLPQFITWSLTHNFDTLSQVPDIKSSVLLVHAENDWDIPHTHSSTLFNALLDPRHPSIAHSTLHNTSIMAPLNASLPQDTPNAPVKTTHIPDFGVLQEVLVPTTDSKAPLTVNAGGELDLALEAPTRKVALLKTVMGAHDIGKVEGVQDVIGRMFEMFDAA